MAAAEVLLALSTFPDEETARKITRALVESELVACGNIVPRVESIYRWQGKVQSNSEVLVLFKLPISRYAEFAAKLKSLHPYDVPEIVAFDITHGSPEYLEWVKLVSSG